MKFFVMTALSAALMSGAVACSNNSNAATPPNPVDVDNAQIYDNLRMAALDQVRVNVDQDKKTVTLTGEVQSESLKLQAEDIARSNAVGYTIANRIDIHQNRNAVRFVYRTDEIIKSQWKALEARSNWSGLHIRTRVKNRVLILMGQVDTPLQRESIERAAAEISGVQQIVNELNISSASR